MAVARKTAKTATDEENVESNVAVEDVNETEDVKPSEDVDASEDVEPSEDNSNGVAVYASHPMYWPGVGTVKAGYSVLTADVAEQWIAQGWVRKASRSEVARQYGIK